jgi:hypothetical protein
MGGMPKGYQNNPSQQATRIPKHNEKLLTISPEAKIRKEKKRKKEKEKKNSQAGMAVCSCNPSYSRCGGRRITVHSWPQAKSMSPSLKCKLKQKRLQACLAW